MVRMSQSTHVKVAKADQEWVSQEEADEVLRREAAHEKPVSHKDLLQDLLTAED